MRRFYCVPTIYVLSKNKINITIFHLNITIFTAVKIAVYCIGVLSLSSRLKRFFVVGNFQRHISSQRSKMSMPGRNLFYFAFAKTQKRRYAAILCGLIDTFFIAAKIMKYLFTALKARVVFTPGIS